MARRKKSYNQKVGPKLLVIDAFNTVFKNRQIREQNGHLKEILCALGEEIIRSEAYGDFLVEIAADSCSINEIEKKRQARPYGNFFLVFCPNGKNRAGADSYLLDTLKKVRYFERVVIVTDDAEVRIDILCSIFKKKISNCTLLSVGEFLNEVGGEKSVDFF